MEQLDPAAMITSWSPDERRDIAELLREFAGRLEREAKPGAKKRADRFHKIASEIRGLATPEKTP